MLIDGRSFDEATISDFVNGDLLNDRCCLIDDYFGPAKAAQVDALVTAGNSILRMGHVDQPMAAQGISPGPNKTVQRQIRALELVCALLDEKR